VRYNAATRTATLEPVVSLEAGRTYVATLKAGGPRDLNGNAMAADYSWTFTTGTGGLTPRAPLTIDNQSNVTLSGVYIRNLNGPCLTIRGGQNIRLENSELGPCQGGVWIDGSKQATVNNVYIHDSGEDGEGVVVTFSQGVTITNNRIERVRTGVYALGSTGVRVERNRMKNMQGPMPRGQFVQFNKAYGGGNRILCNVGENVYGESRAEDAINLYASNGEAADPIQIIGNKIIGGGPSLSGGGVMMGDGGGAYQVARDNILVDPGQYGMAVAGGHDISSTNNLIYARLQGFTNVGMYVWNQDPTTCYNLTIQGNTVNWTASSGSKNPNWNAGNCGTVNGWSGNNWSGAIDGSIANLPIAACQ
jgi:hypothetical protein